jgi:hypothetical protein
MQQSTDSLSRDGMIALEGAFPQFRTVTPCGDQPTAGAIDHPPTGTDNKDSPALRAGVGAKCRLARRFLASPERPHQEQVYTMPKE